MKINLTVKGMTCNHCVATVEKALSQLSGVKKVSVNLKKAQAKIKFDDTLINTNDFKEAIEKVGYEMEELANE